jgi:hypothetical protein
VSEASKGETRHRNNRNCQHTQQSFTPNLNPILWESSSIVDVSGAASS